MKKIVVILVVIIVGSIAYQKGMSFFMAQMMQKARAAAPVVMLDTAQERDIFDKTESAGRLEAKYTVDVVARINGWLQKRYFQEGAFVKKGQVLFLIEPNEYANTVNQAQASVRQARAALTNSEKELKRAAQLVKEDFVSKSYYDNALAKRDADRASLDVARANLSQAGLNYSYTRVTSPIDGKIGSIKITEGNLVNPQTGTLATIVSTNPIYAYFNIKSEELLRFKKNNAQQSNQDVVKNMNVKIKLADGSLYPVNGKIEFVDNRVDPTAGTVTLRATFPNKNNLLVPGDYINVVATSATPRKVITVPQVAVSDSTEGFYVYIVDKDSKAQKKFIKVDNQYGDDWVVLEGIVPGEAVITQGLQKLKPGILVKIGEKKQQEPAKTENESKENK